MFKSRRLNAFYSAWLSVFYGYPTFAWIPTHNLNHHKFVNKAGDATITWRYSKRNTWLIASTYYFVSAYWQAGPLKEYVAKARAGNPALYRQIAMQWADARGSAVLAPRARLGAPRLGPRDAGLALRLRHPRALRSVVDDLHQLHPARPLRPVVGAQPLAQLRLEPRQLPRLQQRLPHRPPRERRPALEQAPRGAREDRAPHRSGAQPGQHLRLLPQGVPARALQREVPDEAGRPARRTIRRAAAT